MLAWVYGIANPNIGGDGELAGALLLCALSVLHLGTGFFARAWVVLALPLVAVVLAVPAGSPSSTSGEPLPIWFGLLVFQLIGLPLMATGIVGAKLLVRRRRALGSRVS